MRAAQQSPTTPRSTPALRFRRIAARRPSVRRSAGPASSPRRAPRSPRSFSLLSAACAHLATPEAAATSAPTLSCGSRALRDRRRQLQDARPVMDAGPVRAPMVGRFASSRRAAASSATRVSVSVRASPPARPATERFHAGRWHSGVRTGGSGCPAWAHQSRFVGVNDELRAVARAQLEHRTADMGLGRVRADHEAFGDLVV